MNQVQQKLHDMFEAYKHTAQFRDKSMVMIMHRRQEFEQLLDDLWRVCCRGPSEFGAYKQQVQTIKNAGLVVMRSKTTGEHKIVYPSQK